MRAIASNLNSRLYRGHYYVITNLNTDTGFWKVLMLELSRDSSDLVHARRNTRFF